MKNYLIYNNVYSELLNGCSKFMQSKNLTGKSKIEGLITQTLSNEDRLRCSQASDDVPVGQDNTVLEGY